MLMPVKSCLFSTLSVAILFASGLASSSAFAQLEEVVVTAQKRAESLQDTPLSIVSFNETALENQGIESLADLSLTAPSLQFYDFPTSTSNISLFLRGFGNTDSQTLTIDNPVGIYIDGVYIARTSGATINVLDLERVEILRGPQGTLFGRNSSAGAISFITKKPAEEFQGKIEAGLGEFGAWNAGLTIDAPITSELRTKLSYATSSIDGWVENKGPNLVVGQAAEDFYQKEQQGYRLAVSWDATENFTLDYSYDWSEVDSTAPYYQFNPGKREEKTTHLFTGSAYRYVLPESNTEQSGHNLSLSWALSDNLVLKSITSYREMDETAVQNWSSTLFFATSIDWSTEAFSQELQLLGSAFNDKLDYIVGYYYFDEEGDKTEEQFTNGVSLSFDALLEPLASTSIGLGGNNLGIHTVSTDLTSQAVYAQGTYTPEILSSRLSITGGVRYTEDERDASRGVDPLNPSVQFAPGKNDLDYNRVDYTFALDYGFSDAVSGYARVATGYRAGGSGERTLDFSQTFDEEESISYELGLKSELFDRRLRVNAAVFMTDYDDLLLTISGQPPLFASFVENFNAGKASIDGFELDVIALLGEATTISFNYTYLDTELKDVIVPGDSFLLGGPPASAVDLRGTDISSSTFIPFAPENAYSIALDHSWGLGNGSSLDFHLNYSWRDEVFSTSGRELPVDAIGLLGGRIVLSGLQVGSTELKIAAWGKNLSDEAEIVYDLSALGFQYNMPRMYGVDISLEF